ARAEREEVTAQEPAARAMTHGAEGVAGDTTAGALTTTATKSALKQLNTTLAGAAAECPGGRKHNPAISGADNTCPTSAPTLRRERAGRQPRLSPASTEVPTGRRESTQEGAIRSSPPRGVAESCQRAGVDKIPHQPGDSTLGSHTTPREEEEGRRSSAHSTHDTTCKELSPAHGPTAEESRASHKPGGTKVHVPGLRYAAGSARCGTTPKPE
ncbi:Methyltransferase Nsun7-Like, partial [Manis pentadactyla]